MHLNLTPFFLFWTVLWVVLGFTSDNHGLFWVAAIPWLFWFGLVGLFFVLALLALGATYLSGKPITLTTPRKGTRVVQRGRR